MRPEDIKTTAHFTVEGELDDISGSGQTEAAHELCFNVPKSHQKHLEVKGAGHYGIFSGRRWREIVYPQVRDFILQFNEGPHGRRRPRKRSEPPSKRQRRARRQTRAALSVSPQASRIHAALPQTQCTRCGYA